MNHEKAKEFFSAYYEDSLSGPLKTTFARRLAEDPALRADYESFENSMKRLSALEATPVQVPEDLHERISARLDKHRFEQRHRSTPPFLVWWRSIAVGTLAASAFLFAVLSINRSGPTSAAGLTTGPANEDQLVVKPGKVRNSVELNYTSGSPDRVLLIRRGLDGEIIKRHELHGLPLSSMIDNKDSSAVIVSVQVVGEQKPTLVALPGTERESVAKGNGTLSDMAKAIAGYYQVPVEITVPNSNKLVSWDFTGKKPIEAANSELKAIGLNAEETSSGTVHIVAL